MKEPLATLCFVKTGDKILLINRDKKPFMGLWNGIGGKAEGKETPVECALREIKEESGLTVKNLSLISVFTWNYDDQVGYVFVCEPEKDVDFATYPQKTAEGILDFKDIDWILDKNNFGVIPDLKIFIENVKKGKKQNYHLIYKDAELKQVIEKE